ncbi:hypothetical protein SFOMI_0794 [Sphingobium fuliginis]|uniref:Uncharacterized protein n=1 Tax=Sphingobium fuliginis (strain ATCC 27551) TaxID=336203 RepID=A0A292ZBK7_SPHSA|nr:hypothetical protein SFOMI_0794 [Sphingobium fuliginis]
MTKWPSGVVAIVSDHLVPAGAATAATGSAEVALPPSFLPQAATVRLRAIRASPERAFTLFWAPYRRALSSKGLDQGNAACNRVQSDP